MRCLFCRKGPAEGVNVYRVNAKGQPGVWACNAHIGRTDAPPIDPDVKAICEAIAPNGDQS